MKLAHCIHIYKEYIYMRVFSICRCFADYVFMSVHFLHVESIRWDFMSSKCMLIKLHSA